MTAYIWDGTGYTSLGYAVTEPITTTNVGALKGAKFYVIGGEVTDVYLGPVYFVESRLDGYVYEFRITQVKYTSANWLKAPPPGDSSSVQTALMYKKFTETQMPKLTDDYYTIGTNDGHDNYMSVTPTITDGLKQQVTLFTETDPDPNINIEDYIVCISAG